MKAKMTKDELLDHLVQVHDIHARVNDRKPDLIERHDELHNGRPWLVTKPAGHTHEEG